MAALRAASLTLISNSDNVVAFLCSVGGETLTSICSQHPVPSAREREGKLTCFWVAVHPFAIPQPAVHTTSSSPQVLRALSQMHSVVISSPLACLLTACERCSDMLQLVSYGTLLFAGLQVSASTYSHGTGSTKGHYSESYLAVLAWCN